MTVNDPAITTSAPVAYLEYERLTLSVREAARVLGITPAHAYVLVTRGELPALRLGRRWLIPKRRLLALIEAP